MRPGVQRGIARSLACQPAPGIGRRDSDLLLACVGVRGASCGHGYPASGVIDALRVTGVASSSLPRPLRLRFTRFCGGTTRAWPLDRFSFCLIEGSPDVFIAVCLLLVTLSQEAREYWYSGFSVSFSRFNLGFRWHDADSARPLVARARRSRSGLPGWSSAFAGSWLEAASRRLLSRLRTTRPSRRSRLCLAFPRLGCSPIA